MVSEIGSMVKFQPAQAKAKILEALRAEGCHKGNAAKRLGCTHGTLILWVGALGIGGDIDQLVAKAIKEGWYKASKRPHNPGGGRPKVKVKAPAKAKRAKAKSSAARPRRRAPARA